ncbi:MAG: NAD-dependent glycerol-3-phosphate dehydrogenase domain protein [Candidatus Uhrbacteria bacterium GW2011_GWC2_41_11]|jgi:glycerol-3-phosphate dehydrogenase (NAD(P)+)|uniref:NAD-dependent glycerol-3-phosphate dehydrogenase domain protein n=1 Tax=Candidatus Uhrbacteria bacterium GW2011_GWC2_41_11 TaxID=1618985 RepID=A0A0G0XDT1_9BACT|nr:MAG: NAD-dependent glycerol-3-phosphate dehydrogenase domain protein [Candidatus Uhrbacteria bacterium GW2011_GWC2_41_11]HBP00531.1 hypothetical protein [Candidatus Uhrbacteria bacterium]
MSALNETSVLIIGAGEIGSALGFILKPHVNLMMWDRHAEKIPDMISLEQSVPKADVVFICVPAAGIRGIVSQITSHLSSHTIVVSLAKGLEQETGWTMDRVLEDVLPIGQKYAILGGPLLAEELIANQFGVAAVGTKETEIFQTISSLFCGTHLRMEFGGEPRAVAWDGVLKNVYAFGLGIAEGLEWGWNAKGWFASQAIREMRFLFEKLELDPDAVLSSAGVGDFLATGCSSYSRNRETGRLAAQTGKLTQESEGTLSLHVLNTLFPDMAKESHLPLFVALENILIQGKEPAFVFSGFFGQTHKTV